MSVRSPSENHDFTVANLRRFIRQVSPPNRFREWVSHQITPVYAGENVTLIDFNSTIHNIYVSLLFKYLKCQEPFSQAGENVSV